MCARVQCGSGGWAQVVLPEVRRSVWQHEMTLVMDASQAWGRALQHSMCAIAYHAIACQAAAAARMDSVSITACRSAGQQQEQQSVPIQQFQMEESRGPIQLLG